MTEEIIQKIKEKKAKLFDLNILLTNVNEQIQRELKELNDLNREMNTCHSTEKS